MLSASLKLPFMALLGSAEEGKWKMPIEFVVRINPNTFLNELELPEVYVEEGFKGNTQIYLTSPLRYRVKVSILEPYNGPLLLRGTKWTGFAQENINPNVALLHFMEEGDDYFYVTGYYEDRTEVIGYHGICIRKRVGGEAGPYAYQIDEDSWETIEDDLELKPGMIVVFNKKQSDNLWLTAFNEDGSPSTEVNFHGAIALRPLQRELSYSEKVDDRMQHRCQWLWHKDHFREGIDTFYKRFSYIQAQQRLAIPAKFQENHLMHFYTKALMKHQDYLEFMGMRMDFHKEKPNMTNHMNVYGHWNLFAERCHFAYDKLIRFRFMYMDADPNDGFDDAPEYPVFHLSVKYWTSADQIKYLPERKVFTFLKCEVGRMIFSGVNACAIKNLLSSCICIGVNDLCVNQRKVSAFLRRRAGRTIFSNLLIVSSLVVFFPGSLSSVVGIGGGVPVLFHG
ncbi:hypothetical protein Tco_1043872 [Tanacetum coccineum]|uniref:Uncharacterized protein n=1 Tax=Tanacetum coccineum TaxID=301880 RepID=A0ABQ5GNA9_9ASTR